MKWLCQQQHIHHLSSLSNGSTIDKTKVAQAAPLQVDTGIHSSIVQLLHTVKAHDILLEKGNGYNNCINKLSDVKRLRLTGRHSKEYMLKCSVCCAESVSVPDLRGISNLLDEKCLRVMLCYMNNVKIVF